MVKQRNAASNLMVTVKYTYYLYLDIIHRRLL